MGSVNLPLVWLAETPSKVYSLAVGAIPDAIFLVILATYLLLNAFAVWKWKGIWRILALTILSGMAGLVALTVFLFHQENNLWPIFLIFGTPVALVALMAVWMIKSADA